MQKCQSDTKITIWLIQKYKFIKIAETFAKRALLFLMRCNLTNSSRSCKGLISKIRLHNENKLATMLAQLSAAHFHPMLTKIIKQWHRPVLVLCFQHIQMLSNLNWIQKSFFHDSFPPKCSVLQFKFYWNYHWKQALFFHKPEAFFHANRCHELSHMPIQLDALLIMKNSAVACSFNLLLCTSQLDKKSLLGHHHHQVPFFRRIIVLFEQVGKLRAKIGLTRFH